MYTFYRLHRNLLGLIVLFLAQSMAPASEASEGATSADISSPSNTNGTKPVPPILERFNYTGAYNYYGEVGVGGMTSGDFDGFSVSARTGLLFGDKLQEAIEFEFLFAKMTTGVKSLTGPDLRTMEVIGGTLMVADNLIKSQGDLEEYVLMLNYRYGGTAGEKIKIPYYIGLGGGINFMDFKNKKQRFTTIVGTDAPINTASRVDKDFEAAPVGQIFAGTGIVISETAAIMVRGRALFTSVKERVKMGKLDNLQTVYTSEYYQLGAEVVFSFIF